MKMMEVDELRHKHDVHKDRTIPLQDVSFNTFACIYHTLLNVLSSCWAGAARKLRLGFFFGLNVER